MEKVMIQEVEITLAEPDYCKSKWVDHGDYLRLLEAAWLHLSTGEPPLNPRLVGEPGLGKTTLVCAAAQRLGRPVYIFQCTTDTQPEDLLIAPVITGPRVVEYRASSVVSAMIKGGILLLDEANRMPERSWASLAALMDERRYVKSAVAGITIHAHPEFRLGVTMNDDSSVYELPGYIQSRLKPRIELQPAPWPIQKQILRARCAAMDSELLTAIFTEVKCSAELDGMYSTRDILSLAQYAQKLKQQGFENPVVLASRTILQPTADADDHTADCQRYVFDTSIP